MFYFQDIAAKFEEDLLTHAEQRQHNDADNTSLEAETSDQSQSVFNLVASETLMRQMEYCWREDTCLLRPLLSHFWKLNLQLVSRYVSFFAQLFQGKLAQLSHEQIESEASRVELDGSQTYTRTRSPMFDLDGLAKPTGTVYSSRSTPLVDDLTLSVLLLLDAHKLSSLRVRLSR